MKAGAGQLRIIGGTCRGRRLPVPEQAGLRPTSERIRETLFNWVAPWLPGARCLDLFAGSGALGFEAASRGAGEVVLLERAPRVARQLRENARVLGVPQVEVICTDALQWLTREAPRPFDLILLDPPFAEHLLGPALALLNRGWLAPDTRLYLESARAHDFPPLPEGWELVREKTAGQVRYALAEAAD